MKYKETFLSIFGDKSDALFKDLLCEYKYLQSLRLVTRGITHNYNNIFAGAIGQIDPDSPTEMDHDRRDTLSNLIGRGVQNTEVLFAFARYKNGERGTHSLQRILHQATVALQAISTTTTLIVNNSDDFVKIEGDFNELVLMLFYLVEHRIKGLSEKVSVSIDVSQKKMCNEQAMVRVTIKDDYPLSTLPDQHDVFGIFGYTDEDGAMTGLGLHISQQIARSHGGDICFENNDNHPLFIVELPTIEAKKTPASPPVHANTFAAAGSSRHAKKVFFLVEDDRVLLNYLASGLQRKGHIAFSTESCVEAVEEFKLVSQVVEVVVIDIGLTDCDGFECVKQLSKINKNVQIIFMSGDIDHDNGRMPPGATFLTKPFTIRQLEALVYDDTSRS